MPTMIQVNGYAGAVAFLFSKLDDEDKGYQFLYEDIQSWLKEQELISDDKESSLIKQIVQVDKQRYRQITAETMALLGWMKRFADGFHIKGDKG